jgi:hypothetical protein
MVGCGHFSSNKRLESFNKMNPSVSAIRHEGSKSQAKPIKLECVYVGKMAANRTSVVRLFHTLFAALDGVINQTEKVTPSWNDLKCRTRDMKCSCRQYVSEFGRGNRTNRHRDEPGLRLFCDFDFHNFRPGKLVAIAIHCQGKRLIGLGDNRNAKQSLDTAF